MLPRKTLQFPPECKVTQSNTLLKPAHAKNTDNINNANLIELFFE